MLTLLKPLFDSVMVCPFPSVFSVNTDASSERNGRLDQAKSLKAGGRARGRVDLPLVNRNDQLTPDELAARAQRWRLLWEAHNRDPEYRKTLSLAGLAELYACINDWGGESSIAACPSGTV